MKQVRLMFAAAAFLVATPALAQSCFEDVGCPYDHNIPKALLAQLSCDALWTVRNTIYRDNGYCFKSQRALSIWGNEGCAYWDAAAVPLNAYERTNINRIVSVEKQKGC
jgi:hypothetical protein